MNECAQLRGTMRDVDQSYVETVFRLLARDKALPKYQFERRVDALLAPFMEELLTKRYGDPVKAIVAEFPLKRQGDFRSTNVDHLFVRTSPGVLDPWIFFELKTDPRSIKDAQLVAYVAAMNRGMAQLVKDLDAIAGRTQFKRKYAETVKRLSNSTALADGIRLLVLSPTPIPSVTPDKGDVWLFGDLSDEDLETYSEEWGLFKRFLLPVLVSQYTPS